jgi:hypothetical protein
MKQSTFFASLVLLLSTHSGIAAETPPPQAIQPPAGSVLKLQMQAQGEQIYQCLATAGRFQWQLKAPDAVLYDAQHRQAGRHYAGPTWEHQDGSRITGKLLHKLDVAPEKALPWLLLEAVKQPGAGTFAGVQYINRIDTQGGLQPVTPCDGNHIGSEKRIPYRASYYFYTAPAH